MAEPFLTSESEESGLIGRVFGSRARGAAAREIEALLAAAGRVTDVSATAVKSVGTSHAVDVNRHLRAPCLALYRRYLEHCFVDRKLSDDEVEDLVHLRSVLALEESDCARLHDEVAVALYGAAVEEALADRRLEPEEEEFLALLQKQLRIEDERAQQALAEATRKARNRFLATATTAEGALVAAQTAALQLEGSSEASIEDAVANALEQSATLLPELGEIEVTRITASLNDCRVGKWHVQVRADLPKG
ncbi:MAG: dodecin domain-containing protein [marine benthic group bacterium]|jgi:flavin-binding protein dodecin|nr:dodecin domain-containing protein [Gemmatimonadota bacterium]MCL7936723.1 dodecin domain-containing protein [Gemmatimonadota bacterium]MCL7965712.1 dodecin domain-containing protein [Gemmatimonadota bacterium]MCL7970400.1 dodecin domain-containing protein [Gemmatimonadota bacterium]MCL7977098.1 dodecin domain-containing protein [Gemmatimonadota bacterium]